MTNKQLSRLRDLKKEIKMYQERLAELQSLSEVKSCVLTGMPVSKSVSDKIGYSVIKIINTKNTAKQCFLIKINILIGIHISNHCILCKYCSNRCWKIRIITKATAYAVALTFYLISVASIKLVCSYLGFLFFGMAALRFLL